jgi:ADP-ribose pyrophosphatase YjhB (NUDIX family)
MSPSPSHPASRCLTRLAATVPDVTEHPFLPPEQYVASLARKRMGAAAFFRDENGRVLIVNPVYQSNWILPGGAVEADESPHAACRREVAEELGLDRPPGRILAVDWVPARTIGPDQTPLPDGLSIVYDGGVLSAAELAEIVLTDRELSGFEFVTEAEAARRVTAPLARRIAACLRACEAGTAVMLENGSPVG